MTATDLLALLPLLVVGTASIAVMLLIAFRRDHAHSAWLTLAGLALAIAVLPFTAGLAPRQVTPLLVIDGFALFYMGLVFAATFAVAALAYAYLAGRSGIYHEEFYLLLLLAALGAGVLVASRHFASFFLGLELLSVALFALIAYPVGLRHPLEAGVKYLILSGVSSALLLFGMALIYVETGTLEFAHLGLLAGSGRLHDLYLQAGLALIIAGVGFKLSVVPFHMWTPDVYEGAPAPVSALLATVSKGAVFALLLRYFVEAGVARWGAALTLLALIAIASMVVGNLLALLQENVKRLLAYSSIAHLGYLFVAFLAGGALAVEAVSFYLVAYFVTTLGAFGVITVLSAGAEREADALADYRGLVWRRPWLAGSFTAMLLSLAGIPLTAGFVGKFYAILAGAYSALWLLVTVLIVTSVIGLFYYLRVIVAMYAAVPEAPKPVTAARPASLAGAAALATLTLLLVWLGVYPGPVIRAIQTAAVRLI